MHALDAGDQGHTPRAQLLPSFHPQATCLLGVSPSIEPPYLPPEQDTGVLMGGSCELGRVIPANMALLVPVQQFRRTTCGSECIGLHCTESVVP